MAVDDLAVAGGIEMAVTLRSHGWCRLTALVRSEGAESKANGEACEAKHSSSHFDKLEDWTEGKPVGVGGCRGACAGGGARWR